LSDQGRAGYCHNVRPNFKSRNNFFTPAYVARTQFQLNSELPKLYDLNKPGSGQNISSESFPYYERCFGGMEKKINEELGPMSLEVDTIGYLVEHLEGE